MEMGVAAGALIKQCILPDSNPSSISQHDRTICFNFQILNSAAFRQVTDLKPPETPVSAATYASQGLPFYDIYNEESDIAGGFENIKSIKATDKVKGEQGKKRAEEDDDEDGLSAGLGAKKGASEHGCCSLLIRSRSDVLYVSQGCHVGFLLFRLLVRALFLTACSLNLPAVKGCYSHRSCYSY